MRKNIIEAREDVIHVWPATIYNFIDVDPVDTLNKFAPIAPKNVSGQNSTYQLLSKVELNIGEVATTFFR